MMISNGLPDFFTHRNPLRVILGGYMTLKEKLAMMAKIRQENAKRLMAWLTEREKANGNDSDQ